MKDPLYSTSKQSTNHEAHHNKPLHNITDYLFYTDRITPDQDKKVSATRAVNATGGGEATGIEVRGSAAYPRAPGGRRRATGMVSWTSSW